VAVTELDDTYGPAPATGPLTPITLALYVGLHLDRATARVAAEALAVAWHVPVAVIHGGLRLDDGAQLFALYDLTAAGADDVRARALEVVEP
jgi:hypothetical protein